MGFFQALSRIVQGKPVFQENEGTTIHSSGAGSTPHIDSNELEDEHQGIIKNNPSTFPVLRIDDVKPETGSNEYVLRVQLKNEWEHPIIVQTVKAFGQSHTLGIWLQPDEAKEAMIYKGHTFTSQPGYEVAVEYKTEYEGDYFQALHDVKFLYNASAKTYEVSSIQLRMPIRDIYG